MRAGCHLRARSHAGSAEAGMHPAFAQRVRMGTPAALDTTKTVRRAHPAQGAVALGAGLYCRGNSGNDGAR